MTFKPELYDALVARLRRQADQMACTCQPYRARTTGEYHWDSCPWSRWMDGYDAAA